MLQILLVCVVFHVEAFQVLKFLLLVFIVLLLGNQPIRERKRQKFKMVFKKEWATQFPWVEPVVDPLSKTHMVHCKLCSLVEGKDKIISPKLDGL